MPTPLELLAPARDASIAREAILHGADAVYIGGPSHGARASAANSIEDISGLVDYAHTFGVKVYVTLNTIIYDSELSQVESNIRRLYDAGVDALIVQDMSILRMDIPPIDLHASTQCDIRTPEKAQFLAACGFSQLVLPREFSLEQIRHVRQAVGDDVVLEAFVHGALCVSYSGDCQASCLAKGRSANRGECAQMCRLPYSLVDAQGHVLVADKHLLSLRDLCRETDIEALAQAGISSFKIEGRLKDATYVKTTVASYRQAIDRVIALHPHVYCRASWGTNEISFVPDVNRTFNRGFTRYFLDGRPHASTSMANLDTPKWIGTRVGQVLHKSGNAIVAKLDTELANGDGLGYFDSSQQFQGFRLNRIEGNRLYPASSIDITAGTELYRNRDVKLDAQMSQNTASRRISVSMSLTCHDDGELCRISLALIAEMGIKTEVEASIQPQQARSPQQSARLKALTKLGNTPFVLDKIVDDVDYNLFIPLSVLTDLRQRAVKQLSEKILGSYTRRPRRKEDTSAIWPSSSGLTYHDNVANRLAERFYIDHGVQHIERALECGVDSKAGHRVMTTRYCIRRELGACLRTKEGSRLPQPLYLINDSARYRLDFDCRNCQMHLVTE